jgi:hypothetical protein
VSSGGIFAVECYLLSVETFNLPYEFKDVIE